MPALRSARFAKAWAGVLPFTTDNLPIIDAVPGLDDAVPRGRPRVRERRRPDDRPARRRSRLWWGTDHGHLAVPCRTGPA